MRGMIKGISRGGGGGVGGREGGGSGGGNGNRRPIEEQRSTTEEKKHDAKGRRVDVVVSNEGEMLPVSNGPYNVTTSIHFRQCEKRAVLHTGMHGRVAASCKRTAT